MTFVETLAIFQNSNDGVRRTISTSTSTETTATMHLKRRSSLRHTHKLNSEMTRSPTFATSSSFTSTLESYLNKQLFIIEMISRECTHISSKSECCKENHMNDEDAANYDDDLLVIQANFVRMQLECDEDLRRLDDRMRLADQRSHRRLASKNDDALSNSTKRRQRRRRRHYFQLVLHTGSHEYSCCCCCCCCLLQISEARGIYSKRNGCGMRLSKSTSSTSIRSSLYREAHNCRWHLSKSPAQTSTRSSSATLTSARTRIVNHLVIDMAMLDEMLDRKAMALIRNKSAAYSSNYQRNATANEMPLNASSCKLLTHTRHAHSNAKSAKVTTSIENKENANDTTISSSSSNSSSSSSSVARGIELSLMRSKNYICKEESINQNESLLFGTTASIHLTSSSTSSPLSSLAYHAEAANANKNSINNNKNIHICLLTPSTSTTATTKTKPFATNHCHPAILSINKSGLVYEDVRSKIEDNLTTNHQHQQQQLAQPRQQPQQWKQLHLGKQPLLGPNQILHDTYLSVQKWNSLGLSVSSSSYHVAHAPKCELGAQSTCDPHQLHQPYYRPSDSPCNHNAIDVAKRNCERVYIFLRF